MGIGSITFSLPHFLTGPHRVLGSEGNSTSDNICRAPSLLDQADRDTILQNLPGLQKIKSLVNSEGKKIAFWKNSLFQPCLGVKWLGATPTRNLETRSYNMGT